MEKYAAYNRLYYLGQPTGRKFRYATGETKESALRKTQYSNARWNKMEKKSGYSVKLVEVKKLGTKKRKPKNKPSMFGSSIFGKTSTGW